MDGELPLELGELALEVLVDLLYAHPLDLGAVEATEDHGEDPVAEAPVVEVRRALGQDVGHDQLVEALLELVFRHVEIQVFEDLGSVALLGLVRRQIEDDPVCVLVVDPL